MNKDELLKYVSSVDPDLRRGVEVLVDGYAKRQNKLNAQDYMIQCFMEGATRAEMADTLDKAWSQVEASRL